MDYAPMGSLRKNLYSVAQIPWKKKLNLLLCIASDLQIIHSQNLIHQNLYSGKSGWLLATAKFYNSDI